ncbi:hypothetical protein [Rubrivivax albus]|uniref:RNA polymerase sigma factor 70 region 4 type 2 domain-containing protein n=1 Tax=Rubrivivax albus TaxID=2499835 RepID=A0A437JNJ8_9BURK|nr:hypothetical protein [Rubrivivax albus]RVT48393.1 hypothetical protein ENE75_22110 [Rubrivivax albus]
MAATNKHSAATVQHLERQAKALELRRAGLGYREIGAHLGVSHTSAHKMVSQAVEATWARISDATDELKALELSRLDAMLGAVWPAAHRGNLGAVDRALKIAERRARLLGLDAPARRELTGKGGLPLVPAERPTIDASKLSDGALAEILAAQVVMYEPNRLNA